MGCHECPIVPSYHSSPQDGGKREEDRLKSTMALALHLSDALHWLQFHSKDIFVSTLMAFLLYRSVMRFQRNAAAKAKTRALAAEKEKAKSAETTVPTSAAGAVKKVVSPPQTITGTDELRGEWDYTGQVQNGQRHGNGMCTWKGTASTDMQSGDRSSSFEGQWANGHPHGFGREISSDGSIFIGTFSEGLRHGKGKLLSASADAKANAVEVEFTRGIAN